MCSCGGFAGIGVGSAMNGLRPIIEFMTFNFSLVAIDQVINSAAKLKLMSGGQINVPIVFRGPTASAGQLGAQHSQAFENWFANTPGLKVIVPSTPYDAKGLLKAAIRDNDPVIFMESEQMYGDKGEVPEGEYVLPIGVADIKKKGTDVTVVSFGKIIHRVLAVAADLEKEGLSNADLKEQVRKINEDASISSKRAKEISEELSNNPGDSKLAKQAEKFAKKSSRDAKKASKLNQELNDNQKEMEDLEKKIKDLEGSLKDLESKINYVPNPQN